MRARLRLITALAATGVAVGALGACGSLLNKDFEDDTTISQKITSVRIDNGSGAVTLIGDDGGTNVGLHRRVEYGGDRPQGATHRIEDGVLVLRGCGDDCAVAYTVHLPAGLPVTGKNSSGALTLKKTGAVSVSTDSGAIDVKDVKGPVDVRADSGAITGRGLGGGPVQAKTGSGAIDLTLSSPQDVRVDAGSGAVDLAVPAAAYRVAAKTGSGGKDIEVENDSSGKYRIDASTGSGALTIKRR
ncbi:DUF4097 family beta strand repeat-containing protein [Streptomyces sp. NPDC049585]|uniref:DUF4097 family beta strand repeat-containing protein n=1 Tax=Streptomyces sp. NPDC049585 TaxID=3155154 RepID=UPI003448167A